MMEPEDLDIDERVTNAIPQNTQKATKWAKKLFDLLQSGTDCDLKHDDVDHIATVLRRFYANTYFFKYTNVFLFLVE